MVMAVTIWHIWEARNSTRNNEELPNPVRTAFKITAYVDLIVKHLYKPVTEHRHEINASRNLWSPPSFRTRVIALNHNGQCIMACHDAIPGTLAPELAEAMALRRLVYLA